MQAAGHEIFLHLWHHHRLAGLLSLIRLKQETPVFFLHARLENIHIRAVTAVQCWCFRALAQLPQVLVLANC